MPSKVSSERLRLAKILLQELREQPLAWTELEKKLLHRCGTHGKFRSVTSWLRKNGYIIKMDESGSRAHYRYNPEKVEFTPKGEVSIKI